MEANGCMWLRDTGVPDLVGWLDGKSDSSDANTSGSTSAFPNLAVDVNSDAVE